jgi:hypothetical protein
MVDTKHPDAKISNLKSKIQHQTSNIPPLTTHDEAHTPGSDAMIEPETPRLDSLERRIERLTSVLIIQSVLLAVIVIVTAFRTVGVIALCLMVALPVLVFYRKSLPRFARALGRMLARTGIMPTATSELDATRTRETSAP